MSRADYGIDAFRFISEPRWLMYLLGNWEIFAGRSMLITSLLMV